MGITVRSERNTYGLWGPEFGSAVSQRGTVSFVTIVFGFEIEGGLHESCAARLAKEAVADVKFIERIPE